VRRAECESKRQRRSWYNMNALSNRGLFPVVAEHKRAAWESSGSSMLKVEATMLVGRAGGESVLHLNAAMN
jgi:hypothetical protein